MVAPDIIGLDIAKNTFHLHGAKGDGTVLFSKAFCRNRLLGFLADLEPCIVAMEACGSAHHWARAISNLGHDVRLIAPQYVKPFVKRLKNDAVDAEAIAEAASRSTMRFVAVKSADQQGQAMTLKVRDLLMAQKVQTINALRSHLAEFGIVVPKGVQNLGRLEQEVETHGKSLPEAVVTLCATLLSQIAALADRISDLTTQVQTISRENDTAKRLRTMPGIGPITAVALATLAPPTNTFRRGRDFAAWVGLTPKQFSTGGKTRLGRTSKMGQRDIRRLLVIGAMAVIASARSRGGPPEGSWLARMLARKPRMLVAIALANKMARAAWAIIKHGGTYRIPASA